MKRLIAIGAALGIGSVAAASSSGGGVGAWEKPDFVERTTNGRVITIRVSSSGGTRADFEKQKALDNLAIAGDPTAKKAAAAEIRAIRLAAANPPVDPPITATRVFRQLIAVFVGVVVLAAFYILIRPGKW